MDGTTLIILLAVGISVLVALIPVILIARGALYNRWLLKNGETAPATILKFWPTHTSINDEPVMGFLLEVRPEGLEPFQAEARGRISRLMMDAFAVNRMTTGYAGGNLNVRQGGRIPSLLPGSRVQVKYVSGNRKRVAISSLLG